MRWLIRMAQWVRNPPSPGRVKLVFAVIALCLLLAGYEHIYGWPAWLTPNSGKMRLPK
jgi:hypothetical protein